MKRMIGLFVLLAMVGFGVYALDKNVSKVDPASLVAKVVWSKGGFQAIAEGVTSGRKLAKADPIFKQDELVTDQSGQAEIVFTDDTLMTFRPGSEFKVSQYNYDPKGKQEGSYIVNLFKGGFRTITGLIAKAAPQNYKVITPVATIGVRGTDYSVYLKDKELLIARHKGKPCVTDNKNQSTLCLDEKTPYASVQQDGVPVPLSEVPPEFSQTEQITQVTFISGGIDMPGVLSNFCITN